MRNPARLACIAAFVAGLTSSRRLTAKGMRLTRSRCVHSAFVRRRLPCDPTRRHEACRRPDAPRSVLGRACLVPMLGLLVASCDGRSSPTTPTSVPTSDDCADAEPLATNVGTAAGLSCPAVLDTGRDRRPWHTDVRFEVTAAGRIYLRLRLLDQYGGGLAVYPCPRATCHNQGFGDVPVLDMADHELRFGDVASVYLENTEPQSTSFVLDFELDVNGSPPICVPSLRTPAPGAVFDNGRTDRRDPIVWDFGWNESRGDRLRYRSRERRSEHCHTRREGRRRLLVSLRELRTHRRLHPARLELARPRSLRRPIRRVVAGLAVRRRACGLGPDRAAVPVAIGVGRAGPRVRRQTRGRDLLHVDLDPAAPAGGHVVERGPDESRHHAHAGVEQGSSTTAAPIRAAAKA